MKNPITKKSTGIYTVVKTADETVNNSNVLQNDDEIKYYLQANEIIAFILFCWENSSAVADLKVTMTPPAGAVGGIEKIFSNAVSSLSLGSGILQPGDGADSIFYFMGFCKNGATAGYINFQWAQNTAEVSDTKVLAGTKLIVFK